MAAEAHRYARVVLALHVIRALSDYDAWKFGICETVGLPRLPVRCRHSLNPDPLPLQLEKDIRVGLSARKGVTTIRGLFQERTSGIHLPEPCVEIAADLSQEMRVCVLSVDRP